MTDFHAAVCQAVSLMTQAPLEHPELIQASDILRNALLDGTSTAPADPVAWMNREGSYLSAEKRQRMIEAGQREGASIGEVTFGKVAQAHDVPLYAAEVLSLDALIGAWRALVNVDPEDPYDHGQSDTLMQCASALEKVRTTPQPQAAAIEKDSFEQRFTAMLIGVISDTQNALGFTDEDKECSNGSLEIVAAIRKLQEAAADGVNLEQFRPAVTLLRTRANEAMRQLAHPRSEDEAEQAAKAEADFDEADRLLALIDATPTKPGMQEG